MTGKRPLQRSILLGSVLFITVLCVTLGIATYRGYRSTLYKRYEAYITDLLTYVAANMDADDMKACLDKGEKSEKFEQTQAFFDLVKDTHRIDFMYVVIPVHPGENDNMMNVIAAMSSYEKEHEPDNEVELGELTGNSYPAETAAKYYNARDKNEIVFFEEVAEWGADYTGILSLCTSDGAFFAELCVDVPSSEIRKSIRDHTFWAVTIIIVFGLLFMAVFIFWSTQKIVTPIRKLEKSVTGFASQKRGEKLVMEAPNIHTHNELESLSESVMKMADDINTYVEEVVEAQRVASEMTELAMKDPLTGLRNKNAYVAYLQDLDDRIGQTEFAIGTCDCNDLKSINDRYGHDKGDEYLKAASELICRVFEHSPCFRIGGDEFAIVLLNEDYRNRKELAEQFYLECDRVSAAARNEWELLQIALGVAAFDPRLDRSVSDTARRADKRMYDNKRGSRKAKEQTYYSEAKETYWKEQYIIDNFKTALEKHWIRVYYQPIMRTKTGKISRLEALARWIDPARGMISPNEFIYVLSRYHRLHALDLYMAEEVCREFGLRRAAGLPDIPVSVNFSAQDFDDVDVPARLREIVEKYRLTPDDLIVEITEQDIAEGTEQFRNALRQIRADGFKLWMDDFGSGYSSLNVLGQYDIDRIKLDMDLTRHLDDHHGANRRIIEGILKVCRDIGIQTLAEGVETESQLAFLREIGCDLVQGYYFFKPESVEIAIYKFQHRTADIPIETREEREELEKESRIFP